MTKIIKILKKNYHKYDIVSKKYQKYIIDPNFQKVQKSLKWYEHKNAINN